MVLIPNILKSIVVNMHMQAYVKTMGLLSIYKGILLLNVALTSRFRIIIVYMYMIKILQCPRATSEFR
jgi:hypothetical protein